MSRGNKNNSLQGKEVWVFSHTFWSLPSPQSSRGLWNIMNLNILLKSVITEISPWHYGYIVNLELFITKDKLVLAKSGIKLKAL